MITVDPRPASSASGSSALRRLEWSALPRVDLSVECRWLLGEDDDVDENADGAITAATDCAFDDACEGIVGDAARRAAKKILQLTLEMDAMETRGGLLRADPEKVVCGDERVAEPQWRASNDKIGFSVKGKHKKNERQALPTKSESATGCPPGAKRADSKAVAQSRASSHKRVETKESHDRQQLVESQRRLAAWLAYDETRQHHHQQHNEDHDDDDALLYSVEVESRIHEAMTRTTGQGLWKDPVASLVASEMTSESVFGGFVPTRRLAFDEVPTLVTPTEKIQQHKQPDAATPNTPLKASEAPCLAAQETADRVTQVIETPGSSTMIHDRAKEIRDDAQKLVAAGNIEDALATLQDGIKQLLFDFQDNQDEIQTRGFPYSQYAHACATRMQLRYRARHRKRVSTIAFLQCVWRRYHAKMQAAQKRKYLAVNARVIQRQYKLRHERKRRERAAVRIQTCFRIYEEQKHLIHLHQACRMLVNEERRKRERIRRWQVLKKRTWRKLRMALQLIGLWKTRLRAASCIQKHWKGGRVRVEYAHLLEAKTVAEYERQAREDAFVQPRLEAAMAHYRRFLRTTALGKMQVTWQMNQPWICFQRLRARVWQTSDVNTKVQALCGILFTKMPGNGKVRDLYVDVYNPEAWNALLESASTSTSVDCAAVQPQHTRKQRWRAWILTKQQAWSHFVLTLYWYVVLWPWSNMIRRRSYANKQRAHNVLERQQQFVLLKLLRHLYRQLDGQPSFACAYCYAALATAYAYNSHVRMCKARNSGEVVEWSEIHKDVAFLQDKTKEKTAKGQKQQPAVEPICPPPDISTNVLTPTFQLDVQLVQQTQATRSTRKALSVLIDMLLCYAVNHPFSSSDVAILKSHMGPTEGGEQEDQMVAMEMVALEKYQSTTKENGDKYQLDTCV
ncbi:hypothetical protein FI667_g8981, partial [Globisporangium splendens]